MTLYFKCGIKTIKEDLGVGRVCLVDEWGRDIN